MKFIKVKARESKTPIYISVHVIGAVVETYRYMPDLAKHVGDGKASILVQGQWIYVSEDPFYVLNLIKEPFDL